MRAVLVGNYGVKNVGDEALREYFLQAFPEIEWTVLSAHPHQNELPRLPAGLRSFFCTPWRKTLTAIRQSDVLVFGGGSLFTDAESVFACFLWFLHARAAYFFGTPYVLAFQGIGPFKTGVGKSLTSWVLGHSAFVSVRDRESAGRIGEISMNIKCVRTFDPVILSVQNYHSESIKNVITLIPRHNSGLLFIEAVHSVATSFPDCDICVLLLQPDEKGEQEMAEEIFRVTQKQGTVIPVHSLSDLCQGLLGSKMVVTERYHGALVALALHLPVRIIPQVAGDKLSALLPYAKDPASFDEAVLLAKMGEDALRASLISIAS